MCFVKKTIRLASDELLNKNNGRIKTIRTDFRLLYKCKYIYIRNCFNLINFIPYKL